MTKKHTKFLSLLIALIMVFTLVSCGSKKEAKEETTEKATEASEETTEEATEATEEAEAATGEATEAKAIKTEKLSLIHEPEFGGAYITMTIDDFNDMGFQYGDSLDITFSNGYKMTDVPYYSGYFAPTGSQFLVGYPGYDYIKAVISNGEDLWLDINPGENDTAEIELKETGKYLDIQNARSVEADTDRNNFESDEQFANFRTIEVGDIKPGIVYRSASPIDNLNNRAKYTDKLMGDAGIKYVMDLSDTDETVKKHMSAEDFDSKNFVEVYESGNVYMPSMRMNYTSDEFKKIVADCLLDMSQHEGPYLIQCTEGKDRTGIVCAVLEALCGATYEELVDDYMKTYENAYHISKDDEKYAVITETEFFPILKSIVNDDSVDFNTADLSKYAYDYLKNAGMTDEQIENLKKVVTE